MLRDVLGLRHGGLVDPCSSCKTKCFLYLQKKNKGNLSSFFGRPVRKTKTALSASQLVIAAQKNR